MCNDPKYIEEGVLPQERTESCPWSKGKKKHENPGSYNVSFQEGEDKKKLFHRMAQTVFGGGDVFRMDEHSVSFEETNSGLDSKCPQRHIGGLDPILESLMQNVSSDKEPDNPPPQKLSKKKPSFGDGQENVEKVKPCIRGSQTDESVVLLGTQIMPQLNREKIPSFLDFPLDTSTIAEVVDESKEDQFSYNFLPIRSFDTETDAMCIIEAKQKQLLSLSEKHVQRIITSNGFTSNLPVVSISEQVAEQFTTDGSALALSKDDDVELRTKFSRLCRFIDNSLMAMAIANVRLIYFQRRWKVESGLSKNKNYDRYLTQIQSHIEDSVGKIVKHHHALFGASLTNNSATIIPIYLSTEDGKSNGDEFVAKRMEVMDPAEDRRLKLHQEAIDTTTKDLRTALENQELLGNSNSSVEELQKVLEHRERELKITKEQLRRTESLLDVYYKRLKNDMGKGNLIEI